MKLKDILLEIDVRNEPYTKSFNFREGIGSYEAEIDVAGTSVIFAFHPYDEPGDEEHHQSEWSFSFGIENKNAGEQDDTEHYPEPYGKWTTNNSDSIKPEGLSYLRLVNTAFEAIINFIEKYRATAVDVTGYDKDQTKTLQKTRIYSALLNANAARLAAHGLSIIQTKYKLWVVTKQSKRW